MTELKRVRVALTGFQGAPGVSTFYFLDTVTAMGSLHDLYAGLTLWMPNDLHIQVENTGDIIESTTGALTGDWSEAAVTEVVGMDTGAFSAPSGLCINWLTGTVLDGHRVKGKTYMVPLAGVTYDNDGTVRTDALETFRAEAAVFRDSQDSSLVVWHRPFPGAPAVPPRPARAAHLGGHALVTNVQVNDKVAVLRSRRD